MICTKLRSIFALSITRGNTCCNSAGLFTDNTDYAGGRTRTQDAMKRENIDLFTRNVEKGQVLEMQNASHYIFQSNQSEVLDAIGKFVSQLP